jgi:GTPase involved in cell partitioning and DNA repair
MRRPHAQHYSKNTCYGIFLLTKRSGVAGFPSVGKSTLLSNLSGVYSEVAAYEFTTLTTVPGVIRYKGAKIQLLDLPGIIEGAKDGKGRGRQVIAGASSLTHTASTESLCSRAHLLAYSHHTGRDETAPAQTTARTRTGRIRHSTEQAAAQHCLPTKR